MSTIRITDAELLDALSVAKAGPEGAQTVRELCASTGWNENRVRIGLKRFASEGRLAVCMVTRQSIAGRPCLVPAYTVNGKGKGKRSA